MGFIAFISYMTCKTIVGTNRSFFLGMPPSFATIMIQKLTFVLINKHSSSCFKIVPSVAHDQYSSFSLLVESRSILCLVRKMVQSTRFDQ